MQALLEMMAKALHMPLHNSPLTRMAMVASLCSTLLHWLWSLENLLWWHFLWACGPELKLLHCLSADYYLSQGWHLHDQLEFLHFPSVPQISALSS